MGCKIDSTGIIYFPNGGGFENSIVLVYDCYDNAEDGKEKGIKAHVYVGLGSIGSLQTLSSSDVCFTVFCIKIEYKTP